MSCSHLLLPGWPWSCPHLSALGHSVIWLMQPTLLLLSPLWLRLNPAVSLPVPYLFPLCCILCCQRPIQSPLLTLAVCFGAPTSNWPPWIHRITSNQFKVCQIMIPISIYPFKMSQMFWVSFFLPQDILKVTVFDSKGNNSVSNHLLSYIHSEIIILNAIQLSCIFYSFYSCQGFLLQL